MAKYLTFIFSLMLLLSPTEARWVPIKDAPQKINKEINIQIEARGNFVSETKKVIRILNERGREKDFRFYYNPDHENFKIAKALIKKRNGQIIELSDQFIEDKPLASNGPGFDQVNQVYLAFPNVEVGDQIELTTRLVCKKNLLDSYFAQVFNFGYFSLEEKAKVVIQSALPLQVKVNDPLNCLKIKRSETANAKKQILSFELKRPLYQAISQEIGNIILDSKSFTWVSVSSVENWQALGEKYYQNLQLIQTKENLPAIFRNIALLAQEQDNEIKQINTVTSLLNEKVRYLGDWRSINGRYFPHDLEKIAEDRVADCKDFARVTQAILQQLGYQVNLVLVHRGLYNAAFENRLPDLSAFNHMIVKVNTPSGKHYWIDPTNFVSMAGLVFPDIACKWGLVIDQKASYERIPAVDYQRALVTSKREINLNERDIWEKGFLNLQNETAFALTGAELQYSLETIAEWFYNAISNNGIEKHARKQLKVSPLKSRIVDQVNFDYQIIRENELLVTNVGEGIKLSCPAILQAILNIHEEDVAKKMLDLFPCTVRREIIIKNVKVPNFAILNQQLKNQWLKVQRYAKMVDQDLYINEIIELYRNVIDASDFNSSELKLTKDWIQQYYQNTLLIIEKLKENKNVRFDLKEKVETLKK